MKKYHLSWSEYDKQIRSLALKIRESQEVFKAIVVIPRGGLVIASHLSNLLDVKEIHYSGYCVQPYNILIVDDVSDTGKTLDGFLRFRPRGCPFKTATLHRKDHTTFEPDFVVKTINEWIVYPWEE